MCTLTSKNPSIKTVIIDLLTPSADSRECSDLKQCCSLRIATCIDIQWQYLPAIQYYNYTQLNIWARTSKQASSKKTKGCTQRERPVEIMSSITGNDNDWNVWYSVVVQLKHSSPHNILHLNHQQLTPTDATNLRYSLHQSLILTTHTTITILQPLYRSTCTSQHLKLRSGGFCQCKVLLPGQHALADGNQDIWIMEKMLEFSSIVIVILFKKT